MATLAADEKECCTGGLDVETDSNGDAVMVLRSHGEGIAALHTAPCFNLANTKLSGCAHVPAFDNAPSRRLRMSHKDLNPTNPATPKRAAIVISNPGISTTTGLPVGYWWFELVHPYFAFTEVGWQVDVYSPLGDKCEADAMSDPEDARCPTR